MMYLYFPNRPCGDFSVLDMGMLIRCDDLMNVIVPLRERRTLYSAALRSSGKKGGCKWTLSKSTLWRFLCAREGLG